MFSEPINSAGMALKVLGNLFQSQNLIEWISGWWSPIVTLFHDFSLLIIPHKANLCLIPIKATMWVALNLRPHSKLDRYPAGTGSVTILHSMPPNSAASNDSPPRATNSSLRV